MKCEEVRQILSGGEASAAETEQIEAHLATCDLCRQHRRGLEVVSASLQALRSRPSSDGRLVRAAIAQFQAEQAAKPARSPQFWGWGMALGATAAASVGLTFYLMRETDKGTIAGSVPSIASVPQPEPTATATPPASGIVTVPTPGIERVIVPANRMVMPSDEKPNRIRVPSVPTPKPILQPKRETGSAAAVPMPSAPVVDDMDFLNSGANRFAKHWTTLTPTEEQEAIAEIEHSVKRVDDFIEVAPPLVAANRNAAVTRAALAQYRQELQVVDARLQRKVSLGEKGATFAELCKKLETLTGITIVAGRNVMEDKVTIFCKERPLRDIMREVATLFNFAWERTGEEGSFSYRLKQPLASSLLEEELRNKDQNEALLALDREMATVRNLLSLSPEEAAQRSINTEDDKERQHLHTVAFAGRGPAQLYTQLSPDDLTALRDGNYLPFSSNPQEKERPLNAEFTPIILQSFPQARVTKQGDLTSEAYGDDLVTGTPLDQHPGTITMTSLWINRSELGQFQLMGSAGFGIRSSTGAASFSRSVTLAEGVSPSARSPKNSVVNGALRDTPEMAKRVTIATKPSCELNQYSYPSGTLNMARFMRSDPKITTADALEAIHKATGRDVIGDYYTRVYDPEDATVQGTTFFDALCNIADNLRLRWNQTDNWLGFRSTTFFYDRQKEIPKRQLERWAAARKRNGYLSALDLAEIAKLSEVQLDSGLVEEGVRAVYGLNEWTLLRINYQRHLRFLASLPPAAQLDALSPKGFALSRLTFAEQQNFAQLMGAFPFPPEAMNTAAFRLKVFLPERKKATNATAEEPPTKDEQWIYLKVIYLWTNKNGELMGSVNDYQSSTTGDAKSLPDLRD